MSTVTAETITDEQIRELRVDASLAGLHWTVTDTFTAVTIGRSDMFYGEVTREQREEARARCAAAWNARHGGE